MNKLHDFLQRLILNAVYGNGGRDNVVALSVVIATYNRSTYLDMLLYSLEAQTIPLYLWEVIVVDAGSQDATVEVIERHQARKRLPLRASLFNERLTRAKALNAGIELSRGQILLLLGDSRIATRGCLISHLSAHYGMSSLVVSGNSQKVLHTHAFALVNGIPGSGLAAPAFRPEDVMKVIDCPDLLFDKLQGPQAERINWQTLDYENLSIDRRVMTEVGGFDEGFPRTVVTSLHPMECLEVGWRLSNHDGVRLVYAPLATAPFQFTPPALSTAAGTSDRNKAYLLAIHHGFTFPTAELA